MNKKKCSIEQKIRNSKFDIIKKSLYFVIAPIVILIIGVILLSTVGFSQGIDFTGGYTFKVYVNNENKLASVTAYDLNENKDYDTVYEKITVVLSNNDVNLVSYQTTKVDLTEYDVYGGQAVKVTYQSNDNNADLIRAELIDTFGYESFDGAVSSIDEVSALPSYEWAISLIAGIVFGLIAAIVYMAIRYSRSAVFVVFIQMALDLFLTVGLMLIVRVTVNLSVGIVVLSAFVLSLLNSFVYYNKVKENRKSGLYEGVANNEMANITTKQILWKKAMFYIGAILVSLLFVIIAENVVRMVALGVLLALVATFYTSTFLLPAFWALVDKPRKAKKKV